MKIDLVGSSAPLGFFDPLGFSKGATPAQLSKYRESELKHGRTAMLAVFGVLTQEKFHPLYGGKLSADPLAAAAQVPALSWLQIFVFCGILEYTLSAESSKAAGYKSGDYFGITARIGDADDASWADFQTRELNNGRLAMFAIIGELAHSALTGKGPLAYWGI